MPKLLRLFIDFLDRLIQVFKVADRLGDNSLYQDSGARVNGNLLILLLRCILDHLVRLPGALRDSLHTVAVHQAYDQLIAVYQVHHPNGPDHSRILLLVELDERPAEPFGDAAVQQFIRDRPPILNIGMKGS